MTEIDSLRREFLKKGLSASSVALLLSTGLAYPTQLLAHWPENAFTARAVEDAVLAIMGQAEVSPELEVYFKSGKPAKKHSSGDSVSVEVMTDLENIDRLAILVDSNPFPLVMSLEIYSAVKLPFKTRIKIAGAGHVIAVVRSGDQLYMTKKEVKVDVGGIV